MGVKWEAGDGFPRRWAAALDAAPRQPVTAAVGWAVVGPGGVSRAVGLERIDALRVAFHVGLATYHFRLLDGYRLARVRIEVIEEGDAARGENDGR
jgi:hypothetical protein